MSVWTRPEIPVPMNIYSEIHKDKVGDCDNAVNKDAQILARVTGMRFELACKWLNHCDWSLDRYDLAECEDAVRTNLKKKDRAKVKAIFKRHGVISVAFEELQAAWT